MTYGTDYIISISKAGSSVEALVYNPETQEIDVADTIGPADAGSYTIRASGMGQYNEAVTDDFELTVKLSDTNLLEQALKGLKLHGHKVCGGRRREQRPFRLYSAADRTPRKQYSLGKR